MQGSFCILYSFKKFVFDRWHKQECHSALKLKQKHKNNNQLICSNKRGLLDNQQATIAASHMVLWCIGERFNNTQKANYLSFLTK